MYLSARTIGIGFERQFDKQNLEHLAEQDTAGSRAAMSLPNVDIPLEKRLTLCEFLARLNRT